MAERKRRRLVKVSLIQRGPSPENKEKIIEDLAKQVDEVAQREKPDFLMPVELATTPYFCGVRDDKYFAWAEPIPGPTTELFSEKAKKYEMCLLLPMFEKGKTAGVYFNSVVVLGPDGRIVEGTLPDNTKVHRYAKNHVPHARFPHVEYDEAYYFTQGPGYPIFDTPKARIGIGICYDRRFPEGWRMVMLQGAEIVFIPGCVMLTYPERGAAIEAVYTAELQTRAFENNVWACFTNPAGIEEVQSVKTHFYGRSCIVHPSGDIVVQAPSNEEAVISATIDLEDMVSAPRVSHTWRYRRPEIYTLITRPVR